MPSDLSVITSFQAIAKTHKKSRLWHWKCGGVAGCGFIISFLAFWSGFNCRSLPEAAYEHAGSFLSVGIWKFSWAESCGSTQISMTWSWFGFCYIQCVVAKLERIDNSFLPRPATKRESQVHFTMLLLVLNIRCKLRFRARWSRSTLDEWL